MASGDEEFVSVVSHWLGDPGRLNAGYNVRCKRFKELDLSDPWVVQMLTGKVMADADSIRLGLERLPTRSRIQILPSTEMAMFHRTRSNCSRRTWVSGFPRSFP